MKFQPGGATPAIFLYSKRCYAFSAEVAVHACIQLSVVELGRKIHENA